MREKRSLAIEAMRDALTRAEDRRERGDVEGLFARPIGWMGVPKTWVDEALDPRQTSVRLTWTGDR